MTRMLTTQEFIEKAVSIHGDQYGYDKTDHRGYAHKLTIFCKRCKEYFDQLAGNHLAGNGCPHCKNHKIAVSHSSNRNEFIEKARSIHGEKYTYSHVVYIKAIEPVTILCNTCGLEFKQRPNGHLRGSGCPRCGHKKIGDSKRKSIDEFIEEAILVHGDRYQYDQVVYKNCEKPVEIFCIKCGISFFQKPANHLNGKGCPNCLYKREAETGQILLNMFNRVARQAPVRARGRKHPYFFDFQVQDNKTFVEYHGIQHYEPVAHFGGEKEFKRRQQHDKIKSDWCKRNGWKLIVVPYWIDDIRSFLEDEFSKILTT